MNITEKISYIKGLVDGMEMKDDTQEKKILLNIVELLDQMAAEVTDIHKEVEALDEFTDELDGDLGDLEEYVYGDDSDGDDDEEDDDEFEYEDEAEYTMECPKCGETICFNDSDDPSDTVCPKCGEHIDCESLFGDDEDEILEVEDAPEKEKKDKKKK